MGGAADKGWVASRLKRRGWVRLRWVRAMAGVSLLVGAAGGAQDSDRLAEDQIKAGFLFNFTRFVEWTPTAERRPMSSLALCIVDDPGIAELLGGAAAGKVVNGRAVEIRRMRVADDLRRCDVVFLGDTSERHAERVLAGLKGVNVLTVGEAPGFLLAGGVFNFAVQENQVRLELNLAAAERNGLQISAKLIAVSRLVTVKRDGRSGG